MRFTEQVTVSVEIVVKFFVGLNFVFGATHKSLNAKKVTTIFGTLLRNAERTFTFVDTMFSKMYRKQVLERRLIVSLSHECDDEYY